MTDTDLPRAMTDLLPRLWRFALRLTGDCHDAEGLVQRACVRALERQHRWQPGTSQQIRQRAIMEWSDEVAVTVATPIAIDPEADALHRQVIAAVDALSETQRTVMLLVAIEGFSYREAASVLDIPIGRVMSRLARVDLPRTSDTASHLS
ncbi:RNA polymerase sigma factor [Paraburkholderia graminis]|uniref:RNA polymerase sigma-70 factor (ECF subfamily) n=1 Tax=Paraburkholderia graminis TaxID=60548 RepID=A0ABD5CSV0_9BURK|nr:RNA polymerase sigma factor [Paraburkholderia graminis]MDR6208093.1 RNA polymerase sigma-70 factor (ECF subfamily) [Paraburkholderia graminis]